METILQRFREKVDNLAEKAREEIKEKFVGKGAIVIVENHGGQKASLKTYIIGIPNDVDKEHLALNVDKLLRVSLIDYSRKAISLEITDPCVENFDNTIFYQDNIRFLTTDIIDEIVKEATSFIPRKTKADFKKIKGANTTRITLFIGKKESDEHTMTIVDFVEIMKTELTKFIKED